MIHFVNAKINIGLQIVRRRPDGYHDLRSVFYPVGLHAGTPANPVPFCDILEITPGGSAPFTLERTGRQVDCPLEKDLVWRAASLYLDSRPDCGLVPRITLDKHLPDGAGMGGGSADAAFTLRLLRDLERETRGGDESFRAPSDDELSAMALRLGADCPFFILNRPAYAEGVGERLREIPLDLGGKWLAVVKPDIYISTKEAFAGVTPREPDFDLCSLPLLPIGEWQGVVRNDFEESIFPAHPEMAELKEELIRRGALYASMTGSGSCLYGIFDTREGAESSAAALASLPRVAGTWALML